jgi:hypothetical protein
MAGLGRVELPTRSLGNRANGPGVYNDNSPRLMRLPSGTASTSTFQPPRYPSATGSLVRFEAR